MSTIGEKFLYECPALKTVDLSPIRHAMVPEHNGSGTFMNTQAWNRRLVCSRVVLSIMELLDPGVLVAAGLPVLKPDMSFNTVREMTRANRDTMRKYSTIEYARIKHINQMTDIVGVLLCFDKLIEHIIDDSAQTQCRVFSVIMKNFDVYCQQLAQVITGEFREDPEFEIRNFKFRSGVTTSTINVLMYGKGLMLKYMEWAYSDPTQKEKRLSSFIIAVIAWNDNMHVPTMLNRDCAQLPHLPRHIDEWRDICMKYYDQWTN